MPSMAAIARVVKFPEIPTLSGLILICTSVYGAQTEGENIPLLL